MPFALVGGGPARGGGAIVGSEPVRVAGDDEDPFAVLDRPCRAGERQGARSGGPARSAAAGSAGSGYRLAARVERIPLNIHRARAAPGLPPRLLRQRPAPRPRRAVVVRGARHRRSAAPRSRRAGAISSACAHRAAPAAPAPRRVAAAAQGATPPITSRPSPTAGARIAAGEIFQANLCLRLRRRDRRQRHRAARRRAGARRPAVRSHLRHPARRRSPSLSPELFLRRRGPTRSSPRPIKGTIARDPDPALAAAALTNCATRSRTRAEHVMIVDLMRNDLGRVCELRDGVARAARPPSPIPACGTRLPGPRPPARRASATATCCARRSRPARSPALRRCSRCASSPSRAHRPRGLHRRDRLRQPRGGTRAQRRHPHPGAGRRPRCWLGAGGGIVADSDPHARARGGARPRRGRSAAVGARSSVERSRPGAV